MARSNSLESFLITISGLQNFSLLTIPFAWLLCIVPHMYAVSLTRGHFKKNAPRSYLAMMQKKQTKSALDEKYLRAEAAQLNGLENLALYAVAISVGNLAGLPSSQLNILGVGYLVSRALFNIFYIFNTRDSLVWLRSTAYFIGMGIIFKIIYSSAHALQ